MVSNNPKISILLSAYNAEKYISESIKSILSQTFIDFELLISDDGSTDNTKSIIDSFTDKRLIVSHNSTNLGKTATINRLLTLSKGQFITIHDADDISKAHRFERQMAEFEKKPNLIMCGTWFTYLNKEGTSQYTHQTPTQYIDILNKIKHESVFHGPTVIVRKKAIDKLGQYLRPFFRDYHEDSDLNMRLTELGECYNLADNLYLYRIVPNSLSKKLDTRKLVLYDVVVHLAKQRENFGMDDLQLGNEHLVDDFLNKKISAFEEDPSKSLHHVAGKLLHFNLKKSAFQYVLKGFLRHPLNTNIIRLLAYCFKRLLKK